MKVHAFPYSVRAGTPAAGMEEHLAVPVIEERKRRLLALESRLGAAYRSSFLGQVVEVLVEHRRHRKTGLLTGLTDRYVRIVCDGPERLSGGLVDVRVTAPAAGGTLLGERVALEVAR